MFCECRSLSEVQIGKGVDRIPDYGFDLCESLKEITIPENIQTIGSWAFYKAGLEKVKLNEGLKSIEYKAFYLCEGLKSISIPDSVKSVGAEAFCLCDNLEHVDWPADLTMVDNDVFNTCTSLSDFDFSNITMIGDSAFAGTSISDVVLNKDLEALGVSAFNGTKVKTFEVPVKVETLRDSTFAYCHDLEYITIPEGVTELGPGQFYKCGSLKAISLPDSLQRINDEAFSLCESLEIIEFGDSLNFLGADVFDREFYDKDGNKCLTPQSLAGKAFRMDGDRYVECDVGHVTVKYDSDGQQAFPTLYIPVQKGSEYSISVPEIDGKKAIPSVISGTMSDDVEYDVVYEKGKSSGSNDLYTAVLVALVALVAGGAVLVHSKRNKR